MERIDHYFEGVAWKYLTAVDAEASRSNQHEFGGLPKAGFKKHLGDPGSETIRWPTKYLYLAEDEDESVAVTGSTAWYDVRRDNPNRSAELRLYYDSNVVTELITAGMLMIIAKTRADELLLVFTDAGNSAEQQLRWLFGLNAPSQGFSAKTFDSRTERSSWSSIWILEQLGIEAEPADEEWLESLLDRFGEQFPTTKEFSAFARNATKGANPIEFPDTAIILLMESEERLFRLLERHIVEKRLKEGFSDVETFISYSLSVQNRRKSRAGFALENHLTYILAENSIRFERGAYTEGRSKPDFLFPGGEQYRNADFPSAHLSMLGVKSSCKERWRQVLAEASRIPQKHLVTLEPGISVFQLEEMKANKLQLVVPSELHETYAEECRDEIYSVQDFINHVQEQQRHM